jgi:YfiH family protein
VIAWDAPGPYRVGFSTREGGVSQGAFASLNLGAGRDDPSAVRENRRIACGRLELDAERLVVNRQRHTATVVRARAGVVGEVGDGLWTDEPGLPLLALGADCVPIAIAAVSGPPALAVVHAGWRGLVAGVVAEAAAALGTAPRAAMIGPAIGPCCYEVGPGVAELFDPDLTRDGRLDLWEAAARALERSGVGDVGCLELCTRCNPDRFYSHRGSGGGDHGAQGVIGALEH